MEELDLTARKKRGRPPIPDPITGHRLCTHCGKNIPLSDLVSRVIKDSVRYSRRCKPCNRKISQDVYWQNPNLPRIRTAEWRLKNLDKKKAYQREYLLKNRESIREYEKKRCKNLTDSYVRAQLVKTYNKNRTISASEMPDELVEVKRLQILIQRQLKENAT